MMNGINGMSSMIHSMGMRPMRPDPEERFNKADANGDGGLDKAEMETVLSKISEMSGQSLNVDEVFSEFDVDDDGVLSQEETENGMNQLREEMGPQMKGRHGGGPKGPGGMSAYGKQGPNGMEENLINMLNSLSEDETESLIDALNANSEEEDSEDESNILDMLKNALENGSFSPLDIPV